MKLDFSKLKKFSEKYSNFAYDYQQDDYGIAGSSPEDLSELKSLILDSGDLQAFQELLESHTDLIRTAADKEFMDSLKDKYPYLHRNLRYYADKSIKYMHAIDQMDQKKLIRKMSNIKTAKQIGDSILSTMEEPSASFFRGLFDAIAERRLDMMKINQIKDDETGFTLSDEILAKGTQETKDKLKELGIESSKDDWYSPDIDKDSEEVIKKWKDVEIKTIEQVKELAEDSGKAAFGNKYNQDIVDDIIKTAKEKFGDDIDASTAWIKNIYRSVWK